MVQEIKLEIKRMQDRIEFLNQDTTKIVSVYAQPGYRYNHGPYFRRLEKNKLKAKIKRREKKLKSLLN